jgi:Type II secretion system (T2SS), protein E, N-terminal domain
VPILARILKDRGIITERQLQEAIQHQVLYGGRLGTSLYELGFITEDRLREALGKAHGVPSSAVDPRKIQPQVVALVSKAVAAKHKVFPYEVRGKTLFLLMVDPQDHLAVAKIGYSLGYIVRTMVVPEFRMIQLLHDYYGVDERWRYDDTHRPERLVTPPPDKDLAVERIDTAETRDEVVEGTLALCHHFFRRVIVFIVREPWVLGWTGAGEGMDRSLATSLRIPLDQPSIFRQVGKERTVFIGRLGLEEENQRFARAIDKRPNTNAALLPISVKGRVVNLVYGDSGLTGNVKASLGDLMILLQKVPRAYLRIIRKRIAEAKKAIEGTPVPLAASAYEEENDKP